MEEYRLQKLTKPPIMDRLYKDAMRREAYTFGCIPEFDMIFYTSRNMISFGEKSDNYLERFKSYLPA